MTFDDLTEIVVSDYKMNGKKTLYDVEWRVRCHLRPFFGGRTAQSIKPADVKAYIARRQEQGAKSASINRELAILKRGFTLASRDDRIAHKPPHIAMLQENNARHGFFEAQEFTSVLAKLPDYARPAITFAYYTGWRTRSEILPMTWDRVDIEAGTVRLYRGTDKNKKGRVIALPQVLKDIVEQQWRDHIDDHPDCPFVFHRSGKRLLTFYKAWRTACKAAGLSGKLGHDFRRTAVRNLVRAGVSERVAMQITGHLTREVFERYNIVSAGDLEEAAKRIDERIAGQVTTPFTTNGSGGEERRSAEMAQVPTMQ